MKQRAVVGSVAAVVVLLGAVAGGLWWQADRAAEREVESLMQAAALEWRRDPLDRSGATDVLRRLVAHPGHDTDPRLIRARGELLLALDRMQDAWNAAGYLATQPGAPQEAVWLGARIAARLHAVRGSERDLDTAVALAADHADATGALPAVFLAWQCAWRGGRQEAQANMAALLQERHGGSPEARLVAALAEESTTLEDLLGLERAFDRPPAELLLASAVRELEQGERAEPEDALGRLEQVLAVYPSSVDARNFAAVALHLMGRRAERDGYLRWLLDSAPRDDQRRPTWSAMMAVEPQGRG